jgi:hypothetical protein
MADTAPEENNDDTGEGTEAAAAAEAAAAEASAAADAAAAAEAAGAGDDAGDDTGGDDGDTGDSGGDDSDWRATILDPAARKHAERFTSLEDMAKATLDGRKQLSKAVPQLRNNASEEAVAEYNKAMGVPERAEDYEFTPPEGMEKEAYESDAVQGNLKAFAELAHAEHIPADVFDKVVNFQFALEEATREAQKKADADYTDVGNADLKKDWGPQYDKEVIHANRGAEWAAESDFEDFRQLEDKNGNLIGDNPLIVRMFNKVGRAMSEDGIGSIPIDDATASTLREELNTLTAKQDEHMQKGQHQQAQAIDLKIMDISRKISGDEPVVGA